jgi:hypothetical protein
MSSYLASLRTHSLVFVQKKLVGSPKNTIKIAANNIPIVYNEVYLRNIRISGSGGAVPAVIFARFSLAQTQTFLSVLVEETGVITMRDSIFPFYPNTVNDQERLIAHGERASSIMNSTVSLVTFDTAGVMVPFTDFTEAVVELVLR